MDKLKQNLQPYRPVTSIGRLLGLAALVRKRAKQERSVAYNQRSCRLATSRRWPWGYRGSSEQPSAWAPSVRDGPGLRKSTRRRHRRCRRASKQPQRWADPLRIISGGSGANKRRALHNAHNGRNAARGSSRSEREERDRTHLRGHGWRYTTALREHEEKPTKSV